MFLIRDQELSGISFWCLLDGVAQRAQPVDVVPWRYCQKSLSACAPANIALLVWGLLLFDRKIYSERWFSVFYVLLLLSTLIKIWKFFPSERVTVTTSASIKLLSLALIDFCGTYLVFGVAMLVLAARAHIDAPPGKSGSSEETYLFMYCVLGGACVLFTRYTLLPAIAFWRGRSTLKEPS